jgi:hypothetical protein
LFAGVALIAVATSVIYVVNAKGRTTGVAANGAPSSKPTAALDAVLGKPHYIFRSAAADREYGNVAVASLDGASPRTAFTPLQCDRVDYAAGRGICLRLDPQSLTVKSTATVFDDRFHRVATLHLPGYPSRARVSPDGRLGATTEFVSGDSYADVGFSTRTNIIDLRTGAVVLDLEKLTVRRDGDVIQAVDFNFWGVTFAKESRRFYATLGTGGHTYLVQGDVVTKEATVLRDGVECPMLSPDNTKIAFKQRVPGSTVTWRVAVLDVVTLADHPLAETRDIDDQPQWLDDDTVMYGLTRPIDLGGAWVPPGLPLIASGTRVPADTWAVPADGSGTPRRLLEGSWSADPVRPG